MWEIFLVFLKLGLTSFGGPVAHLGYFRTEFVERRQWLDDRAYGDLIALCQFLPGPASSQTGFALGLRRGGFWGGVAAFAGFTLPSAALMVAAAYGVSAAGELAGGGLLAGLKIAAAAVVANALMGMARTLAPDRPRRTLALGSAALVLFLPVWPGVPQTGAILAAIGLGAAAGLLLKGGGGSAEAAEQAVPARRRTVLLLVIFLALLAGLPWAAAVTDADALHAASGIYRSGALVFGGGHVVLPLLEAEAVAPGYMDRDTFLAGYGLAQALPGPLFAFSAYLGAAMTPGPGGAAGGLIALALIFLPGFLLVGAALPHWTRLQANRRARRVLNGVNAAVVGVLGAAFYTPVWTSAMTGPLPVALGLIAFAALAVWRAPPWAVVLAAGASGWAVL
ncbi:MAG: chromate efflux transporter [Alphaproteobacteria bacterium]